MNHIAEYNEWLREPNLDENLREELYTINDSEDIEERFCKHLEFGTAGIRGVLGVGTNRLNVHTIERVSEGLARVIVEHKGQSRGVVIGYDVRYFSREFAELTAEVFAHHGIKVHLFDREIPTPLVSYAIRELNAISGVMITASHNPKEYNGYKVYWDDGTQITDEIANSVSSSIEQVDLFNIERKDFQRACELREIEYINESLIDKYVDGVKGLSLREDVNKKIGITYSPLNGAGKELVSRVLFELGYENLSVVEEQSHSDPSFKSTPCPNPEDVEAFELSMEVGEETNSEVLIATDPDADRVGVMVKHNGSYEFISGNKLGTLIAHYILENLHRQGSLMENSAIVKTIVTDNLISKLAEKYNAEIHEVHVGFKNVYSLANKWDEINESNFIFGYEESLGFGIGSNLARDNDAISAAMIIVEMVAHYSELELTLVDVYNRFEEEYGYHSEGNFSIVNSGIHGQAQTTAIVEGFRNNPIRVLNGSELVKKIDYLNDDTGLEKLNVLKFEYEDGTWFAIRPSGTEPKLKVYVYTSSEEAQESKRRLKKAELTLRRRIEAYSHSGND